MSYLSEFLEYLEGHPLRWFEYVHVDTLNAHGYPVREVRIKPWVRRILPKKLLRRMARED